jgi:RsiW-degrading membrane proteinase PrsW (M82 family)
MGSHVSVYTRLRLSHSPPFRPFETSGSENRHQYGADMTTSRISGRRGVWRRIFAWGLALWVLAGLITYLTANAILIPTLVLLGSFLVPVTFVAWAFEQRSSGEVTTELLFHTFVVGGVLGVLAASLAEAYLLQPSPWLFFGVGLIEEAIKLAALAFCARNLRVRSMRDGVILGATVGFGFAAFESAGYALTASFTVQGMSLVDLVSTELLRGLLAPVGHGLWTAILGGVLFAHSTRRGFAITGRLVLAFLGVSILHGLWDSMGSIAVIVTYVFSGESWQYRLLELGYIPEPTAAQVAMFTVLTWSGLAAISVVGLLWLFGMLRARSGAHV